MITENAAQDGEHQAEQQEIFEFVIQFDSLASEAYGCEALSFEGEPRAIKSPPIAAGDFVIIHDKNQNTRWFGQVIEPQRNIPQGMGRDNPSTAAAMERVLSNQVEASVFTRQTYYYNINLLGEISLTQNRLQSVSRRPRAGSLGRKAKQEEVIACLGMPEPQWEGEGQYNNLLGCIHNSNVVIPLSDKLLYQHLLVAGATGSGKSNSVANIIKVAQAYGMCVIVFDHKPDYLDAHTPNDEERLFGRFADSGLSPFGLEKVAYYSLFNKTDKRKDETQIAVRASDVSDGMLAAAMFYQDSEELQQQTFRHLINYYVSDILKDKDGTTPWTIREFLAWFTTQNAGQLAVIFGGAEPNATTIAAIKYKLTYRKPEWMDGLGGSSKAKGRGGLFSEAESEEPTGYFEPLSHLQAGNVMIIRINATGREYGLFLSYMLNKVFEMRRDNAINFPILNIVDEAQDIFQGSRAIRESASASINEIVRKGRSKQVGFVFALQSVTQLPNSILNNLNSRIIHRQNTDEEVRAAIPGAPKELVKTTLSFGSGEALVSLLGVRGVLHAEMFPSPFMLTKSQ